MKQEEKKEIKTGIEKNSQYEVSVFIGMKFYKNVPLSEIIKYIKSGFFDKQIVPIREGKAKDNDNWKELKKKLLAFTPCGTFNKIRQPQYLENYNKLIVIDIDHVAVNVEEVSLLAKKANEDQFTYGSFISPSGIGIKIFTKVNSDKKFHETAYKQVADYFTELLGIEIDRTGKDVTRLCYISSDEGAYLNENAAEFIVEQPDEIDEKEIPEIEQNNRLTFSETQTQFEKIVAMTKNRMMFTEGNRNNFVHLLANSCNRWGIQFNEALKHIENSEFSYDPKEEVVATVASAYKNVIQHNQYPLRRVSEKEDNVATLHVCTHILEEIETDNCFPDDNPVISDFVYENLPNLLKKGTELFSESIQRDILLTGSLGVFSGCFPTLTGLYNHKIVYPNLYVFVTAPAANSKGIMDYAKSYGDEYHYDLVRRSSVDKSKPRTLLYIPGNASSAAIMGHLDQSEGSVIFFETEADAVTTSLKNDWGNYSEILRKGFHHENVSQTRKANFEYNDVKVDIPGMLTT